jgi:hypothetical protein
MDRLKQVPGMRKVGATSGLLMDGGLPDGMFLLMTQNEVPKTFDGFGALISKNALAMRISARHGRILPIVSADSRANLRW